jgi:RND family efflux transporter MFP subunit
MSVKGITSLVLVGAALIGCGNASHDLERALPVVRVEAVAAHSSTASIRYSAIVKANRQVELDFKLPGYVRSLGRSSKANRPLQEGDVVAAGAILATVDPADYAVKLETARAAVLEAEVAKNQAERDQKRATNLTADGAIPQVELERRTTLADTASARLARAKAALHEAELAVNDTTLRAPFSGTILNRIVEQGAFVTPRTPGYILADTSTVKVVFGVPDTVAYATKMGQLTTVELPSLERSIRAPISRISPSADPRSRLFELEVTLPNENGELKVGLAATVVFDGESTQQTGRRVPLRALVSGPQGKGEFAVFTLDAGQAPPIVRSRVVSVTRVIGDDAVVAGLEPNVPIVTLGASLLHDGDRVQVAQ